MDAIVSSRFIQSKNQSREELLVCLVLVIHDCNKEIIELLLSNGADTECFDKSTNTTALQMAVIRGNFSTTQLLINAGANYKRLSKVCLSIKKKTVKTNFIVRVFCIGWRKNSSRISCINKSNGKIETN